MTQVNPVKKAGRYVLLGLLCIGATGTSASRIVERLTTENKEEYYP